MKVEFVKSKTLTGFIFFLKTKVKHTHIQFPIFYKTNFQFYSFFSEEYKKSVVSIYLIRKN